MRQTVFLLLKTIRSSKQADDKLKEFGFSQTEQNTVSFWHVQQKSITGLA